MYDEEARVSDLEVMTAAYAFTWRFLHLAKPVDAENVASYRLLSMRAAVMEMDPHGGQDIDLAPAIEAYDRSWQECGAVDEKNAGTVKREAMEAALLVLRPRTEPVPEAADAEAPGMRI